MLREDSKRIKVSKTYLLGKVENKEEKTLKMSKKN